MNEHGFYENHDGTVYYSFIGGTRDWIEKRLAELAELGWGPEGGPVPAPWQPRRDGEPFFIQAISGPPARWVTEEEE